MTRGERGEGLSGLSVVYRGEPMTGEHLLQRPAKPNSESSKARHQAGERQEARARERELRVMRAKE